MNLSNYWEKCAKDTNSHEAGTYYLLMAILEELREIKEVLK